MTNDRSYFMRRAAQERSAAANAAGEAARNAHQELASRYRGLAENGGSAHVGETAVSD